MANEKFYCFSCMSEISAQDEVCSSCGHDNHSRENGPGMLQDAVLKNRYHVGRVLGRGGFGITYIGYDMELECAVAIKEYFPGGMVNRDSNNHTLRALNDSEESFSSQPVPLSFVVFRPSSDAAVILSRYSQDR